MRKEIPAEQQAKLLDAYQQMTVKWKEFLTLRETFVDMVKFTRTNLDIKDHEVWDIEDDCSAFTEVPPLKPQVESPVEVSSSNIGSTSDVV